MTREAGFTLVEVLVALSIFALVGTLSTGLLVTAIDARERQEAAMGNGLFGSVEAWRVSTIDTVMTGWEGEAPRPETAGDVLVLERFEKELYSIYWNGSAYRSHQHYRFVEP